MIDLGTALADPTPTTLRLDEIGAAATHYDLPVVLDVPPFEGPIPDDPTTVRRLAILARPDWILALRKHSDPDIERLCIAGTGDAAVVATRRPDAVVLRDLTGDPATPVIGILGPSSALQFDAVNLPTHELAKLLDSPLSTAATARRLSAMGVPEHTAETLATSLRHSESRTQIVGIASGTQFDEHLTVFDTQRGRLLVTSTLAADGVRWSSLTPGTAPRIGQAVRTLVAGMRRFSPSGCRAPG
ncbi:MAG TPA: ESX secretion-associated protein EspG [Aldersonia sp.]